MMEMVAEHGPKVGIAPVCCALVVSRATAYRHWKRQAQPPAPPAPRPTPHRALSQEERHAVLDTLHEPRFVDQPPGEVYATLLDQGIYLCSVRTMYRILDSQGEVRERRDQLEHPPYATPELVARRPNEVWSWDITIHNVIIFAE